jgi:hypothetical protein
VVTGTHSPWEAEACDHLSPGVPGQPGQHREMLFLKLKKKKKKGGPGRVAQGVECLPSKCHALCQKINKGEEGKKE